MTPSIGLPDKRSAESHDTQHKLRSNRSTSVPAQRLHTGQIESSVRYMQNKPLEEDLKQTLLDQGQQKTVCKVPNNQLGPGRAKSLNREALDQQTSASVRVPDSFSEVDHTALATSRTKLMHTNLDQPRKDIARIEKTGIKLPMYHARLTVIPPYRDETIGDVRCNQIFNTGREENYLDDVFCLGLGNLIKNDMKKNKSFLPSGLSNLANGNRNNIASKETDITTSCNSTACSHIPIGCGVDCRKVKTCDSTKELRCAYSKKNVPKSKAYSIADALKSTINTGKIIERSSGNHKSCEDDTSTSQFQTSPYLKTFLVHNRAPTAVESNTESKLSMLPSDFFDSSYKCAIRSVDDDYLTDLVSANDVSFRKPGEQKSVSSRSDTDAFLNQRTDVLNIEVFNKESLSDVIIENKLAKDRLRGPTQLKKDELFHTFGEDHLSSKQYTMNPPYLPVSKTSQEQTFDSPQPVSNRHGIDEVKDFPNQQSGYQNYPPETPRWKFEEAEKLVNSQRVQFPAKQVCTSVTPTKIVQSFQQSKAEDHTSNQETMYVRPNPKEQHCYALPRLSQPIEGKLQHKALNDHEFRHQTSEENIEKYRQNKSLLTVCDESCQTNLTVTARSTKEPGRGKNRPEAKKSQQQSNSRDPPKVVRVEMKAPSGRHAAVSPVSRKQINKISPSRLSRFERTVSTSKKLRASKHLSCYRSNFFSPKMCLRNLCPCPSCSQNVSLLESAILYHTGNSPHARSEDVVVASCLNQYIELIFSGLDSNNTGFITEEQFEALMRTLGCETHISTDKTLQISSVDFPRRLWQCWSQNHSQTTYLDKPKSRKPLLESILSSKSDIESMENLSGQLEDINTSMKSVSSSDSIEYGNIGQGLGHRLWQNKQRDLARSKENRCLKGTLRDLRAALLRLGVENVILKVKILLESPGSSFNSLTAGQKLDMQHAGKVGEFEVLSKGENSHLTSSNQYNIDECSKCRKHKCPDVHLSSLGSEPTRNLSYDTKMTYSEEGSYTKFPNESPEWKSKINSLDDNLSELYLTMNGYQKSPTARKAHSQSSIFIREQEKQPTPESKVAPKPKERFLRLSENMYVNQSRRLYEENPIYSTISNDDQYEYMAIKTNMDLGHEITNYQSSLDGSDSEEEVSSFESDAESCPRLVRSYGGRSKTRVSFSTRSSRSSRNRRSAPTSRPLGDYTPPLLPRRRYIINQPKMSPNQGPSVPPHHLSPTSFGTALAEMGDAIPNIASTPIPSEKRRFSQLKNPIDTLQKSEVQFDKPQHNYTKYKPISQDSESSSLSTSESRSEKSTHSDATNEQVVVAVTRKDGNSHSSGRPSHLPQSINEQHGTLNTEQDHLRKSEQSCQGVKEASECFAEDVLDSDLPRGALKSSRTSLKTLLSSNIYRKTNTGRDPKTPKKTISGTKRISASMGKLLNKIRL